MIGFNPWIDLLICVAFGGLMAAICYVGSKYDKAQKAKLRGASRV